MKKFYILLSAACVVASASAVEKQMAVNKNRLHEQVTKIELNAVPMRAAAKTMLPKVAMKSGQNHAGLPGAIYPYFHAADNVMAIGNSEYGYGYNVVFGFASSYGSLDFYNYSENATAYEWTFADINDYKVVGEGENRETVWNYKTTDTQNLSIKSGVGELAAPVLKCISGSRSKTLESIPAEYLCGGSGNYWLRGDDYEETGDWGVSFYQNYGLKVGNYYGYRTYFASYDADPDAADAAKYNEYGVSTKSIDALQRALGSSDVKNVHLDNFTILNPAPASTYAITKAWISMQIEANAATQLVSYIYPFDEEGYLMDTPIAYGTSPISKGDENYMPIFTYVGLDEDGDETEDEILIDGPVAFTFEGFAGNDAIKNINVVSGYYPFSYEHYSAGNYDICKDSNLYESFTADVDGETVSGLIIPDNYLYYVDENDDDTLSPQYAMLTMDAEFRYIYAVNGEESVELPVAGGTKDVVLEAFYYDIPALIENGNYEISYPEWLDVTIGKPNSDYECVMTIKAAATEAGRAGDIVIEGLGAKFSLTVQQGETGAVNAITTSGDVKYFDLAGRQVANPEKGLYIKVSGNKAEKVIL